MKYFTIQELTYSSTAVAKRIDNTPPPEIKVKLMALVNNCLDPIREKWGKPINVNSGFRCPTLNNDKDIKGVPTSQHTKGEAADITAGSPRENERLFNMIIAMRVAGEIEYDQLIDESGKSKIPYSWIHISYKSSGNRGQQLHL